MTGSHRLEDVRYLREEQYATASNLATRIGFHDRYRTNPTGWHRWVFDQLQLADDARVLEVGCGSGRLWANNIDRVPAGWRITLSDLSPGMLREAEAVFRAAGHPVTAVRADAIALPFADGSFTGAIANHMLYHVADRVAAVRELRRVLAPGGVLIAATNGRGHLAEVGELVARHAPDAAPFGFGPEAFGLESGAPLLERAFGRVERVDYPDELRVTDADALVDYVRSLAGAYGVPDEVMPGIRADVQRTVDEQGAFVVSKRSGLFRCTAT